MTARQAPTHYLRTNEREWTPAQVAYLDTETTTTTDGDREILGLRCWVARCLDRRPRKRCRPRDEWHYGTDPDDLADVVERFCAGQKSTWLFTHNLGFDLTTTGLLDRLAARGWTLGQWSTAGASPWFRLRRDGHALALTDSVSWLQKGLDQVAPMVGLGKLPLPAEADGAGDWAARCVRDVEILSEAMNTLMTWWETQHLGNWTITGNGCGWNAMRHRTPGRTILVRTGDGGREWERQGIYGGRRDATRWGDLAGGPFVTVDFADAYPTIAAHLRLPAARLTPFDSLPLDARELDGGAVEVMAECVVATDRPRYPLRQDRAVWYPVGVFTTTLAHPEIVEARDRGELVSIGRGWRYRVDGHLSGWAAWVMDLAAGRVDGAPEVARLPAKRWGRSVLGRFAQRVGDPVHIGLAENVGWAQLDGWSPTAGTAATVVDIAGERWLVTRDQEADDSFPAVLAWVESHCRVRLGRMLDWLGEGCWVVCNTDGAVIDLGQAPDSRQTPRNRRPLLSGAVQVAADLCEAMRGVTWPLVARPKDSYATAWVAGPQTLTLDGERILAGVPKSAHPGRDGRLEAHLWPGLPWQMANGSRSGYVRPLARYSVPAVTVHRWVLRGGRTLPLLAGPGGLHGRPVAPGPRWDAGVTVGDLAPVQSRAVTRLAGRDGLTLHRAS